MFCPEGYRPLAELWDQFKERRLRDVYRSSARHFASEKMIAHFVRGSPLDICEHVFLVSTSLCGLCLASPNGHIQRIYAPLEDGVTSLCSVLPVPTASNGWAVAQIEEPDDPSHVDVAGPRFKPWDHETGEKESWIREYPDLDFNDPKAWQHQVDFLRHHTLPLAFERKRFLVVSGLPNWTRKLKKVRDLEIICANFAGWAICMSDAAIENWQPYLEGRGVYVDEKDIAEVRAGGRPAKQEAARRDYWLTFPNGHVVAGVSWKNVPWRIEEKTGLKVSEATLRRALKEDGAS